MKINRLFSYIISMQMQMRVKITTEKLLDMLLGMCRSKWISSLNKVEKSK